jgi:hypothetical protein
MAFGSDGETSKATDRVGKLFGESGKSVQRRLKVLKAIEEAEADGEQKRADRLTDLLDGKHITKALALLDPKKEATRPVKNVDVPRTLHDHVTKTYSENFEACAKAVCLEEVQVIAANVARLWREALNAMRRLKVKPMDEKIDNLDRTLDSMRKDLTELAKEVLR